MIRSFLNIFLPKDEYKRIRILYFMAETTFITVVLLLLFGLLKYFLNLRLDPEFILLVGPFLMMAYTYVRYIFSGIEHTEISNKQDYRKKLGTVMKRSLVVGGVFCIAFIIIKGIPSNFKESMDIIVVPILVIIFSFLFDVISLKQSFEKNKELDD